MKIVISLNLFIVFYILVHNFLQKNGRNINPSLKIFYRKMEICFICLKSGENFQLARNISFLHPDGTLLNPLEILLKIIAKDVNFSNVDQTASCCKSYSTYSKTEVFLILECLNYLRYTPTYC